VLEVCGFERKVLRELRLVKRVKAQNPSKEMILGADHLAKIEGGKQ
jgi:hypothetical protein